MPKPWIIARHVTKVSPKTCRLPSVGVKNSSISFLSISLKNDEKVRREASRKLETLGSHFEDMQICAIRILIQVRIVAKIAEREKKKNSIKNIRCSRSCFRNPDWSFFFCLHHLTMTHNSMHLIRNIVDLAKSKDLMLGETSRANNETHNVASTLVFNKKAPLFINQNITVSFCFQWLALHAR